MLRTIAVYLLMVVVPLCPYTCWGDEAAQSAERSPAAGCCCCGEPVESGEKAPASPADDRDSDCLCQGAILDTLRPADLELAAPLGAGWVVVTDSLPSVPTAASTLSEKPHHFPPLSTGRDVRALTCSLLI